MKNGSEKQPGWIRRMVPLLLHQRWALILTFGSAITGMLAT
jgi:hypothetical protein